MDENKLFAKAGHNPKSTTEFELKIENTKWSTTIYGN